jgi:hypothetical protein
VRRNLRGGHSGSRIVGGAGGSPVDQRMMEGRQYARGRGPYIPAQPEDRWDSTVAARACGEWDSSAQRQGGRVLMRRRDNRRREGHTRGENFVRTPASRW